ncbi:hypothetical protein QCA50_018635 [Cerrena zonata]|uniref:DUF6533 domain-containing protein n=1 Tax=Cerrena zonata TaxID=2478898 RepID=A0AAW0FG92_9APHY
MSSSQASNNGAKLVAFLIEKVRLNNEIGSATDTLVMYDYLLSLSTEIRCIWKRKFSAATILYFINRYGIIFYRITEVIQVVSFKNPTEAEADTVRLRSFPVCNVVFRINQCVLSVVTLTIPAFLALRLYAIWNNDIRVFVGVFCLSMVVPALNIYYLSAKRIIALPSPLVGCGEIVNLNSDGFVQQFRKYHQNIFDRRFDIFNIVPIFNASYSIIFAVVIMVLTWAKTAAIVKMFSAAGLKMRPRTSLVYMLLRDGISYLGVISLDSLLRLLGNHVKVLGSSSAITQVIQSILMSHFLLNLRSVYMSPSGANPDSPGNSLTFTYSSMIVGNLGAPLRDVYDTDEEEDEEEDIIYVASDPLLVGLDTATSDAAGLLNTKVTEPGMCPDDISIIDIKAECGQSGSV